MSNESQILSLFNEDITSIKINSKKVLRALVENLLKISEYLKDDADFKKVGKFFTSITKNLDKSVKYLANADYEKLTDVFGKVLDKMVKIFKLLPLNHKLRKPMNDLYAYMTVCHKLASKISIKVHEANALIAHLDIKNEEHLKAKETLEEILERLKSTKQAKVSLKSVDMGNNAQAVKPDKMIKSNILKSYRQKEIAELDQKLAEFGNLISEDSAAKLKDEVLAKKKEMKEKKEKINNDILEIVKSKFSTEKPDEFKEQFKQLFNGSVNDKVFTKFVNSVSDAEGKIVSNFISNVDAGQIKKEHEAFKQIIKDIRGENRTTETYSHKNPG